MLNLIKLFFVGSAIYFFTISHAFAKVASCYDDYSQQLLFTAKVENNSWQIESSLGTGHLLTFKPCYYNEDFSVILNRSSAGGSQQVEISITPGTNRTKGQLRVGGALNSEQCSMFGKYQKYTFTCDSSIP